MFTIVKKTLFKTYAGLSKQVYILALAKLMCAIGCFVSPFITLILTQHVGMTLQNAAIFCSLQGGLTILSAWIGGKLADMFNKVKLIEICYGVSVFCYFICGIFPESFLTVILVAVNSSVNSIASLCIDTLIADYSSMETRQKAYSLSYLAMNAGMIIGPSLAGVLYNKYFNWVFWGDGLSTFVALILIFVNIKASRAAKLTSNDITQYKIDVAISIRRLPAIIMIGFASHLFFLTINLGWYFLIPTYITKLLGNNLGPKTVGVITSLSGLTVITLTPILTNCLKNVTKHNSMILGGVFYAVAFIIIGFIPVHIMFILATVILTIGEILTSINIPVIISNYSPKDYRARNISILSIIYNIATVISPLIIKNLIGSFSFSTSFIIIGVITFIFCFLSFIVLNSIEIKEY